MSDSSESTSVRLAGLVPCHVADISVHLPEPYARLTLALDGVPRGRSLVIPVSMDQARQLVIAWTRKRTPRPLTAELVDRILVAYQITVAYAAITDVKEGTYLAELGLVHAGGAPQVFEARPSDAIAFALGAAVAAPILINPMLCEQQEVL